MIPILVLLGPDSRPSGITPHPHIYAHTRPFLQIVPVIKIRIRINILFMHHF